jgi:hypothetical protein
MGNFTHPNGHARVRQYWSCVTIGFAHTLCCWVKWYPVDNAGGILYGSAVVRHAGEHNYQRGKGTVDQPGPIVLMETGATAMLVALSRWSNWLNQLRYGLYSNDWWPAVTDNVGRYTPADFPGYSGLPPATAWGTPSLQGDLAVIQGAPITWTRGVGFGGGWVFGYYVVDSTNTLILACRAWGYPGTIVGNTGQTIMVTPTLGIVSRYQ